MTRVAVIGDRARRFVIATCAVLGLLGASCAADGSDVAMGSGSAAGSASAASAGSSSIVDIGLGLQGPSGLTATAYATGLTNVAALAFDSSGALWASTATYEDDGTDGVYRIGASGATPVKVIDDAHTPLGLLWIGDTLFVASAAQVAAYTGFDGTSFASSRIVVQFDAAVGEVNELAVSPSGRLVVGISAPCNGCDPEDPQSASIVSFEPDGSDVQLYATDIRAPVGLTYYPGTDTLFVTMNQRDDLGDVTPGDWLAVVTEGQSWGFPDCYGQGGSATEAEAEAATGTFDCATQPTPVAELDEHAAVSGVAIVTGQLGDSVGTSAIVAEWMLGKLVAVPLDPASPATATANTATDFVTGLSNPVPVISGPDGALYVGDWTTGVVYRIALGS